MAHLVGSTAGFGATAHKIILHKIIYSSILFLITQMSADNLFIFIYGTQISRSISGILATHKHG